MNKDAKRVEEILAAVKPLAAEYYRLTNKPLGVTGEVAEYVAAQKLGLTLAPPRTSGYDAIRKTPLGDERIQIKGRAFGETSTPSQRLGSIKPGAACDTVLLVILDNATLEPTGMWEAPYPKVIAKLAEPGSTARNVRGSLSISAFKQWARPIWSVNPPKTPSVR
ncbi:hypothetical protein HAP41_0000047505 (plasmid) [Bradyrhizobium barranii subsp. apii]|uniref:Uncharacterized protein n=1 Tax=Bradyrhizobium barranii subsp. apii TaxID=2819348 RepID=A0A8T5VJ44_9BRAD|nr:hypothetical protein [Bradyrhizobium barranii]UPT92227.1 hypothetical protein HAP41_0000047505 [Bradyrhizobium barranii subsp. apii]